MPTIQTAPQALDRHFLDIRCGLLDLAAALDRIERSDAFASAKGDARLAQIRQAIGILASDGGDRAERIQLLFSDAYVAGWNKK
ncbi:MAG: hypothetical protein U0521_31575 [Anaerolineae bacterium]